jgi:2-deoxy-D-gluconate 3-dehydrogenase
MNATAAPFYSLSELLNLGGKTALVTGGAMGIGQAIALRLATAGAHVAICDLDEKGAIETAVEIGKGGGSAEARRMDVADAAAVTETIEKLAETRGGIDILVNNAGIYPMCPFLKSDDALWQKTLEVNLLGAVRCTRAVLPHMQKSAASGRGGAIVNVASIDGFRPSAPYLTHYGSSKAALMSMTKSLAWELRGQGIRVNGIAPGAIKTPGTAALMPIPKDDKEREKLESMERAFVGRIALKRRGQPDDVARVVLFLASPLSEYMTGEILVVDGGYLLS